MNKPPQYHTIQNIYLQNEDHYFFVIGFISNTENTVKIFVSRQILPSTLNTILSCFIDLFGGHEYFTIFPVLAIHTTYSGLSSEVELALLNVTNVHWLYGSH